MGDYVPVYPGSDPITFTASAAIVGGRPVEITGDMTVAEAAAGLVPMARSSVVDVTPYAMPSEPSTSWAPSPTRARRTRRRMATPCE